MKVLDILQEHMKKVLPVPEGVRINFVFRTMEEFPTVEELCHAAGISREAAESVLEKYVHYGVATLHRDSRGERYEYVGPTEDIKRLWRKNPVRAESLTTAIDTAEAYLQEVERSTVDPSVAEEVARSRQALSRMREEFLGK